MGVDLVKPTDKQPCEGSAARDPLLPVARLAGQRNRFAMRQVIEAVAPAMLRAIRKVMGHRTAEVEDVLQDAVEGLLQALPTFKGECTVLHFACRVAVLSALAFRRRSSFRAQFSVDGEHASDGASSPSPSPIDDVCASRRRQLLGCLLDDLAPAQAEVLVLHCALGFSVAEIAASLACPVETVRSRLRLSKQALRARIAANHAWAEILEVRR
jgi:RNA polymerase sigma factor (sigma-70 family)